MGTKIIKIHRRRACNSTTVKIRAICHWTSPRANKTDGTIAGISVTGLTQRVKGNADGIIISGIETYVEGNGAGLMITPIFQNVSGMMSGLMISPICNKTGYMRGIQIRLINIVTKGKGMRFLPIINVGNDKY